jgi:hypothetical protein
MSTTLHCGNGCTRINTDNHREPVAAWHGHLCRTCVGRLEKWLREIPERYALVPQYLLPSADLDANPESKATKRPVAPPPVRVAALDLLDTRLGRKWQGTEPTTDRRGALGTLLAIANEIRANRGSTTRHTSNVLHEADTIRGQLDWLTQQDWVVESYQEIRILHRELGDATGQYPPKPVGTCYVIPDGQQDECGGPLLPSISGVNCPRCGTRWGHDELRRVGMALSEPA